ncbi:MAG: hypothetical protein M0R46_11690 [Candidatus Muirbacterium halophilum]|nr:hypothetical protein [Candidatus Muirbacterium halophilum]
MAKETKLDKVLKKRTIDVKEMKKLCNYGTAYHNYWFKMKKLERILMEEFEDDFDFETENAE